MMILIVLLFILSIGLIAYSHYIKHKNKDKEIEGKLRFKIFVIKIIGLVILVIALAVLQHYLLTQPIIIKG